jgi:hypothetical protein
MNPVHNLFNTRLCLGFTSSLFPSGFLLKFYMHFSTLIHTPLHFPPVTSLGVLVMCLCCLCRFEPLLRRPPRKSFRTCRQPRKRHPQVTTKRQDSHVMLADDVSTALSTHTILDGIHNDSLILLDQLIVVGIVNRMKF